jgi:5-methylcytosine-specific restriction endonuclease McrA
MNGLPGKKMSGDAPDVKVTTGIGQKECSKCGIIKPMSEFAKHFTCADGHRPDCKLCVAARTKKWYWENTKKAKEMGQKWRESHKDYIKKRSREAYLADPQGRIKANLNWQMENRDKYLESRRRCAKKIRSTSKGRLNDIISGGMNSSLKIGSKGGRHWETLVDFTVEDLKKHLEKKFKPGMTWENCGRGGWHIDHIIPISAFNFELPEDIDFKRCWALKNLQPLWAAENLKKHNKLNSHFQPSFAFGI